MGTKARSRPPAKKKTSRIVPAEVVEFPCVLLEQDDIKLALFAADAKTLWTLVQINTREPDKNVGYQRVLSPARVSAIKRFIDAKNVIPTSVLVSFATETAQILDGGRKIRIANRADAGWVIDGQHRLAGANEATRKLVLPVVAFIGLNLDDQIHQFVVINREARGVPSSLYLDLLRFLPPGRSDADKAKERAADIANELRRDEESSFFGRIVVVTSPQRGELSLNNFVRKTAPLVQATRGRLAVHSEYEQRQIIDNYYKAIRNVFPTTYEPRDSVFFQTLGFGAMLNLLPTVLDYSLKFYSGFRVGDAAQILKRIEDHDFTVWKQYGTGNAAEAQAADDLRTLLALRFTQEEGETGGGSIKLD